MNPPGSRTEARWATRPRATNSDWKQRRGPLVRWTAPPTAQQTSYSDQYIAANAPTILRGTRVRPCTYCRPSTCYQQVWAVDGFQVVSRGTPSDCSPLPQTNATRNEHQLISETDANTAQTSKYPLPLLHIQKAIVPRHHNWNCTH